MFLFGCEKLKAKVTILDSNECCNQDSTQLGMRHLPIVEPISPQAAHSACQYCDCILMQAD